MTLAAQRATGAATTTTFDHIERQATKAQRSSSWRGNASSRAEILSALDETRLVRNLGSLLGDFLPNVSGSTRSENAATVSALRTRKAGKTAIGNRNAASYGEYRLRAHGKAAVMRARMNVALASLFGMFLALGGSAHAAPSAVNKPVPAPALAATFGYPAFALAPACAPGRAVVQFFVVVSNTGLGGAPANPDPAALRVVDDALPKWSVAAALPALGPGSRATLMLALLPNTDVSAMAGAHRFRVLLGEKKSAPLTVSLPAACIAALTHTASSVLTMHGGTLTTTQTPTPNPKLGGLHLSVLPTTVSPVINLHPITNPDQNAALAECRSHGDTLGIGCAAAMSNSWYVLVWDWPNNNCPVGYNCTSDIDGYRVYFPGTKAPPVQIGPGAGYTIQAFDPKAMPGNCVAVTAYKGKFESGQSYSKCLGTGDTTKPIVFTHHVDVTLQPTHMRSSDEQFEAGTGVLNSVFNSHTVGGLQTVLNGVLITGYSYSTNKSVLGDSKANDVRRGAVAFDLSAIKGHPIDFATLHIHVLQTMMGNQYQMNYDWSCTTTLSIGMNQWWYDVNWLASNPKQTLSVSQAGPEINIDLAKWMSYAAYGAYDNGFILIGGSEDLGAFTEASCQTQYDHVTLEVGYRT